MTPPCNERLLRRDCHAPPPDKGSVAEFAAATNAPVINSGDGPGEHPSQALLDLYTIDKEFSA